MSKVNFTLKTRDEEQNAQTLDVLKQLREVFGEESVEIFGNWDLWVDIYVKETMGYVRETIDGYGLHIFRTSATIEGSGENKRYIEMDILLENIETIYSLG